MPRKKKRPKLNLPPHVVSQGGKWHVRMVYPTDERTANGKIKYLQVKRICEPATALRAAEIAAFIDAEMRDAVEGVERPKWTPQTLGDFMRKFLDAKKGNVTSRTLQFYETMHSQYIKKSKLAAIPLTEIEPLDVQSFYSSLTASPSAIKKVHILLSMAFRQAMVWRVVERNPTTGALLPKYRPTKTNALTEAEARAVVKAARTDLKYAIIEFGLATGLRPEELVALKWSHIDLAKRTVRVSEASSQKLKGGGFEVKEVKTKTSERTLGFSEEILERLVALKRHQLEAMQHLKDEIQKPLTTSRTSFDGPKYERRRLRRKTCKQVLARMEDLDLVFPNADGGYMSIDNANKRLFKELIELAGLDPARFSIKTLRHSCASILAQYLNPSELQKQLGHADPRTTFAFYVHADKDSHTKVSDVMSKAIYGDD